VAASGNRAADCWQTLIGEGMSDRAVASRGRNLNAVVGQIREEIASSYYREGGFLPSTRELAGRLGVSAETVRRGLKQLEREGVLEARPRSGFKVAEAAASHGSRPVAFVTDYARDMSDAQPATWALSIAFQSATAGRDWSLLGAHGAGRDARAVVDQILGGNAWGVILDTIRDELRAAVLKAGLPVVMVNSWWEGDSVDVALQDNYRGGFIAADHLVRWGAERIAWFGATGDWCHSRERFGGAVAGLLSHGRDFAGEQVIAPDNATAGESARKLLSGKNRPDGVLAFGRGGIAAIHEASKELGLKIGRDLEAVGWIVEDCYDLHYRPIFGGGYVPPAVVWSAREMAERAVALLAERGEGAGRRAVRACVATELRVAKD
jgi:DNA-binding LacI/PurR family transcriptional regulator